MTKNFLAVLALLFTSFSISAQRAYFIDGYHGGIYGHIPEWQTRFMVDKLYQYPDWKINLELEPESWDTIAARDKPAYDEFVKAFADQSSNGRIEYINPAYGQSYLYNISGESIIRQFGYGMRKLRQHFPGIVFTTYSSEEPCFTSALPQILRSYGFKYASLKNPETCWGGYSRAYGGELVNWIGSDGSRLVTVPRYEVEALRPGSVWETIACNNSVAYIKRAFQYGIQHPIGMCLQDAGWDCGPERNGPWIQPVAGREPTVHRTGTNSVCPEPDSVINDIMQDYAPTVFETWRGYIGHRSVKIPDRDWPLTQEDILVSLTWGGQVVQQIAQEVRAAENKIIATEKLAAMAAVYRSAPWPGGSLDEAWRTLLLSQHHDCWIVPLNNVADQPAGTTWADHVVGWTGNTNRRCDSILDHSMTLLSSDLPASGPAQSPTPSNRPQPATTASGTAVRIFNTTMGERNECVSIPLPAGWQAATIWDHQHHRITGQPAAAQGDANAAAVQNWLIKVRVPSMGYATYTLEKKESTGDAHPDLLSARTEGSGARAILQKDGTYKVETDIYNILIDPAKGGTIKSLVDKQAGNKEFVDSRSPRSFGELRGNFYNKGGFRSSVETPAAVRILENGPLRVKWETNGQIAGTPFRQVFTVNEGERRIDVQLEIDWQHSTGIGLSPETLRPNTLDKPFYNDSFKLQALFPLNLLHQKVYKNAPFDVLRSRLANTFFNSWDSIKNVVLLNWVDLTDGSDQSGMALLSDHTTSYAHGLDYPLGLTVQYSGSGVFGTGYTLQGPTVLHYALVPHTGRWDKAGIWTAGARWNEPLLVKVMSGIVSPDTASSMRSMLRMDTSGWEITSVTSSGRDLLVRLFNAEGNNAPRKIYFDYKADSVSVVGLNNDRVQTLPIKTNVSGQSFVEVSMPRFGFRTLRFETAGGYK